MTCYITVLMMLILVTQHCHPVVPPMSPRCLLPNLRRPVISSNRLW